MANFKFFKVLILAIFFLSDIYAQNFTFGTNFNVSMPNIDSTFAKVVSSSDGSNATVIWKSAGEGGTVFKSSSATISESIPTWGTIRDLSQPGGTGDTASIALSSDGTKAIAIWRRQSGAVGLIETSSAVISGNIATWGEPIVISDPAYDALDPQIDISDSGNLATAIWRYTNLTSLVRANSAVVNGTTSIWGTPIDLSLVGESASIPQVNLSADGTKATSIWRANNVIQSRSASIVSNSGTWGSLVNISTPGEGSSAVKLALTPDGNKALAIWQRNQMGFFTIQSRTAVIDGANQTWGPLINVAEGKEPQIILSEDGTRATAFWERIVSGDILPQSGSAVIDQNIPNWGFVSTIDNVGQSTLAKIIGSADGTTVRAVYLNLLDTSQFIKTSSANVAGNVAEWSEAVIISSSNSSSNPDLAASADGLKVISLWQSFTNNINTIVSSVGRIIPPVLKVNLTKITVGNHKLGFLEKTTRTTNSDGSITVRTCAKFKKSNTNSRYRNYGVALRTDNPEVLAVTKITKNAPCYSFTITAPGTYQAYYKLMQNRRPTLLSKKSVYTANY